MNLEITSRHHDYQDNIKEYAREKMNKLTKYYDRIIDAHLVMDHKSEGEEVEVILHIPQKDFFAKHLSQDVTKSIDEAIRKVGRQLKKYVEKRKEKK